MAVDCKFSYQKESSPIVLHLLGEKPEVLLDLLVHSLSLSVCLRVVCSCQLPVDAEFLIQCLDESGRELRFSVTDDTL